MKEEKFAWKVKAAGRVNIIGEHVDYCGGKVLPAALSLCNTVYVRPNGTDKIHLRWTTLREEVTLDLHRLEEYRSLRYGNYQAGSALFWQRAGHQVIGCDMLQDCTVPFGGGLSSSAAIEVSTIAALAVAAGEAFDPVEVALTAQRAEREFAGVNCGVMDQYASACGRAGQAMLLDCKTLDCKYIPVNTGEYRLILFDCNKPHILAASKYNERRAETEAALGILRPATGIDCLADLLPADLPRAEKLLPPLLFRRVRHVVEECERVRLVCDAMRAGDMLTLGDLLNRSHASLRDLYETTGREADILTAAAREHPACVGSRLTGGGFGGCTVSLVRSDGAEDFEEYVCRRYERETGLKAVCHAADIADGIAVTRL